MFTFLGGMGVTGRFECGSLNLFQSRFMSLLSALIAAIISLWSLRDPGACVSFTEEQAYAPKQCKALQGYADANTHLLLGQTYNAGPPRYPKRTFSWLISITSLWFMVVFAIG